MRQLTLAEIKKLENKEPIPSFVGTITKVYKQRSDVGEYGPWWLQDLIVSDGAEEVKVIWTGEDAFDEGTVGATYLFECSETKHGLKGVSWDVRAKGAKKYEGVKVTPTSKIKLQNGAEPAQETEIVDPDWPEVEKPPKDAGVEEARRHIMRAANLYNLCIRATVAAICPNIPDEQRTNEQFQSTLASIWIEASGRRSTNGVDWWSYIDKMPDHPIK